MNTGEEGEDKAAKTKHAIKAILKAKKMNTRFDKIAAQLGQAEAKRGRGQKEEMVERLPL